MQTQRERQPVTHHSLFWPGIIIGIGIAGTLDDVILHQLLRWHHLYDRSDQAAGLISDGLFHIFSTVALAVGMILAFERWRDASHERGQRSQRVLLGSILLGLGGFNLYDGTIQHKVLRIHQVRPEADNWLPYDISFVAIAVALIVAGLLILRGAGGPTKTG